MIRLFFRLPWFVYLILGLLAVGTGVFSYTSAVKFNSDRKVALSEGMPALVDAGAVNKSSFTSIDEINVGAQISDQIFTASVSGRRTIDKEKTVIFGFSEEATSDTGEVNVVFMLDPSQNVSAFVDKFATGEVGALSPKIRVNGASYNAGSKLGKVIGNAAGQAGLKLSSSVQYVEPFMSGRELDIKERSPQENFSIFAAIGAVLGGFGLFKFFRRPKRIKTAQVA